MTDNRKAVEVLDAIMADHSTDGEPTYGQDAPCGYPDDHAEFECGCPATASRTRLVVNVGLVELHLDENTIAYLDAEIAENDAHADAEPEHPQSIAWARLSLDEKREILMRQHIIASMDATSITRT